MFQVVYRNNKYLIFYNGMLYYIANSIYEVSQILSEVDSAWIVVICIGSKGYKVGGSAPPFLFVKKNFSTNPFKIFLFYNLTFHISKKIMI